MIHKPHDSKGNITNSTWLPHWWLAAMIVLLFGGLSLWYSFVIPAFETPDEHYHYAFARHLAQGNPLPVQAAESTGPWQQEGSQAPLYYWLVGRLIAGIDQSDFETLATLNPRANLGDPLFPGNKNRMLYSAVDWPLAGANLALRIGRWLSVVLGMITLMALYATARHAFPARPGLALLALATAAFLPQFVFLSASFTNDTLVIALASLTLWQLARLVVMYGNRVGAATPIPWWEWAVVGVLLGLAALSKLQGLGLWLLAALVGGLLAWQRRDWRVLWAAALPVALPALAIAGWWYWRNITLYGDWTGLGHLAAITGERTSPLTWGGWWREFRGLRYSSWGLFGWFNLLLPLWVYTVLDVVTALAIGGGLGTVWAKYRSAGSGGLLATSASRVWVVVWLWVAISAGALLYWISRAEGSQGRLIFPALAALAILLVGGLDSWRSVLSATWTARIHVLPVRIMQGALPLFLLTCTLYTGAWLLPRTYAAPPPVAAVPDSATPVNFYYGEQQALHLLAMEVAPGLYRPGDSVPVTLYLTLDLPPLTSSYMGALDAGIREDYQLFIQFLDETGLEVGNLTSHPGWGRNPTSLWLPGAIYADTYPVQFNRRIDPHSPLLARIYIGFVNPATEESGRFPIPGYDGEGNFVDPTIAGHVVLHPLHPATLETGGTVNTLGTRFGEWIELRAAAVERTDTEDAAGLYVRLLWEAVGVPPVELTAFVHVLDENGVWLAGFDAAPSSRFPTQYWQPEDRILTDWTVTLPEELADTPVQVWVGLYPAAEMGATRTPITQDAGQHVEHDMVRIAQDP